MSDIRQRLSDLIDEFVTDDLLKVQILEAFEVEKPIKVYITCKSCKRGFWYSAKAPDTVARVKALSELLNQAKGTPAQTIKQTITIDAINSLEQLEALSDRELAELAYPEGYPRAIPETTGPKNRRKTEGEN